MTERWLSFEEARDAVRSKLKSSVGQAGGVLKTARQSGEVRIEEPVFLNEDGIVGMRHTQIGVRRFNEDDLLDWLDRQYPTTPTVVSARYPGDAALIEEGREMLARGKQKRAVARELAERAEGVGTFESKVDRLRRLL